MKKRFLSLTLATIMAFSSISIASASSIGEEATPDDPTVPEGYRVIKEYDSTTEDTKVDMQVEGQPFQSELNTLQSAESIPPLDETEYEILENETHLYRDLQEVETGDVITQFKTDMVVAADPFNYSGGNTNDANTLKLTITLYYHKQVKNNLTYLGLDKAYWRYDKGTNWTINNAAEGSINNCEMLQFGPGIDNRAKNQRIDCSPLAGDLFFAKTYLATTPSGWIDVLEGGLATEVGLKTEATFNNQNTNKTFKYGWSLTLTGKGPL